MDRYQSSKQKALKLAEQLQTKVYLWDDFSTTTTAEQAKQKPFYIHLIGIAMPGNIWNGF